MPIGSRHEIKRTTQHCPVNLNGAFKKLGIDSEVTVSGFDVTAIEGLSITGVKEVGEVTPQTLIALSKSVLARDPSADGIFISCGGLLTLDVIPPLEAQLGLPATASSPAGFWDVMRLAGQDPSSPGYGRLFESGASGRSAGQADPSGTAGASQDHIHA